MRRFKFRLEAVLNHRETIESLREQDFAKAQGFVATSEARIAGLKDDFRATVVGRPGIAEGERFDAPAIQDRERYLTTITAAIAEEERRLAAARIILDEARRELVKAKQAREAVSRLKEKDRVAHAALEQKAAQDALDEMATMRHARAMRDARSRRRTEVT